jgi:hypothetical protein
MARSVITNTTVVYNGIAAGTISTATTAGLGWEVTAGDFSKLVLVGYNSDTAACAITINAATSGTDWAGKGIGSLSTSIASSARVLFGPFEGFRFESTNGSLQIDSASTASSMVVFWAWSMP